MYFDLVDELRSVSRPYFPVNEYSIIRICHCRVSVKQLNKPGKKYHSTVYSTKLPKAAMWYSVLWSKRYELRVKFLGFVAAVAKYSDQWKNDRTARYHPNRR